MAVVLTRPSQEAQRWAARLREHGHEPLVLPLLAIAGPPDPGVLQRAAADADHYAAVMFVSANAVQGFFACKPPFARARAWAPGPATGEALRSAGVPAERIDAPAADAGQFDSESLWEQVDGQLHAGDRLLLVRGADGEGRSQGRDWLAQQLAARGVAVDTVAEPSSRASSVAGTGAPAGSTGGSSEGGGEGGRELIGAILSRPPRPRRPGVTRARRQNRARARPRRCADGSRARGRRTSPGRAAAGAGGPRLPNC